MLADSEALVKPCELMRSLGPIPPGDGGSTEQGGLEGVHWQRLLDTVGQVGREGNSPCSSPWMGRTGRQVCPAGGGRRVGRGPVWETVHHRERPRAEVPAA